MDIFDLSAIIRLDSSQYESKLDSLKGSIGTIAKVGGAALTAATGAAVAFAKSSVDVGMSFDSAMSQVAATMGTTTDQITELRDFAQEMGSTTAFSATQAADAMNILAMAGYSANESMETLPAVLSMAAAGGLDIAQAADYATGIMAGFSNETLDATTIADKLATVASNAKGDVASFGEGLSTVAGMANTTGQSMQDMTVALGILGNNNYSAAEAGNALSRTLKNIYQPTDAAADAMQALGVSAYDAEGNARPLQDVLQDLNKGLDGMNDQAKNQALSEIFDAVTLKSVPALLNNAGDAWNELDAIIEDSTGNAEKMAEVQLDNLEGDTIKFKSALEGVQLLLSDQLTPNLREFVQFGTKSLSTLSEAFKEGGLSGAMDALGGILSEGLALVIDKIPVFVDAGVKLLTALGKGIISNIPKLLDAAGQIVTNLIQGIQDSWSETSGAMDEMLGTLADYISEKAPEFAQQGLDFIAGFVQGIVDAIPDAVTGFENVIIGINDYIFEHLPEFTEKGFEIITNLATGIIENLPTIIEAFGNILANSISNILTYLPQFLEQGANFILNMVNGIGAHSGEIFSAITSVISNLISIIMTQLPAFLSKGIEIIMNLAQGILNNLPELLSAGTQSAIQLLAEIASHLPEFLAKGIELLGQVGAGLIQAIPDLIANIPTIISSIVDTFMSYDWLSIGVNIISGIGSGIVSAAGDLVNSAVSAVSSAWNAMTGWLGIKSPSRKAKRVIGRNWALGIGEGFEENFPEGSMTGVVESAMKDMQNALSTNPFDVPVTATVEGRNSDRNGRDINAALYELLAQYLPQLSADRNIYFNDGTWAGRLAPTINEELGRIAQWEAAQ